MVITNQITADGQEVKRVPKRLFIGGNGSTRTTAETWPVERSPPPAGRSPRSPTRRRADAVRSIDAPRSAAGRLAGPPSPRARRNPAPGLQAMVERADELALLMTLEMGESPRRVEDGGQLCRRILPLIREQAIRIDDRFQVAPTGRGACSS